MKTSSVLLPPGMIEALDRCAKKNDMVRSELIRYFCSVGLAEMGEYASKDDERRARSRKVLVEALIAKGLGAEFDLDGRDFADIHEWPTEWISWLINRATEKIGEEAMDPIMRKVSSEAGTGPCIIIKTPSGNDIWSFV